MVHKTLQYERDGDRYNAAPFEDAFIETVPSLAVMSRGALNVLSQDEDGFVLMIEGGAVDWASHGNSTSRMIEEMADFNAAFEAVVDWVEANSSWNETLLVITGDHECGYLTGETLLPPEGEVTQRFADPTNNGKGNVPGVVWRSGGHTNSVIPLFAIGNGSEELAARAVNTDPVRGAYLDIIDIPKTVFALWEPTE